MPLSPRSRLGPYEILDAIGGGGMGEVYRARDTRLDRDVAIKVLPERFALDPDRLRRFEQEARAVAALNHPHICQLYDIGPGYLVLEYVDGKPLQGPLGPEEAVHLALQIAAALEAAHRRGILHRDIKPSNIVVTASGCAKLLDFGLAKLMAHPDGDDLTQTREGAVVGTVPYMSPEQVRGRPLDVRSDIFSFGSVLYEVLAGRPPFQGSSAADVAVAIVRDEPAPLDVPSPLAGIVARCLAKHPDERIATISEVREALVQLLSTGLEAAPVTEADHPVETGSPAVARDRPSIAVLPFANLSGDREQEYFADGIVEEIIAGLSRIKWLLVISRSSTFIYKGRPIDIRAIGRQLSVRYVLEGSVRRAGSHVRVTGQLTDAETAAHVWAGRFDGTLDDIFTVQDELTMNVIGAVEPTLRKVEIERARRKRPESLDAYDLFLRALPFAASAMPDGAEQALTLLQRAIQLEPEYAVAHGFIAWCHEQRYLRGGLHAEVRDTALHHARAAITAGGDDALALTLGGFVIAALDRDYVTALDALDRALALSPSSALGHGFSSIVRAWTGDYSNAVAHGRMGIRLSPYDPLIYLPYVGLAYAHFFAREYDDAMNAARKALQANPGFIVPQYLLTGALVRLGRLEEAKVCADRLRSVQPGFTVGYLVSGAIVTAERMADLADALGQAGVPE